MWRSWPNFGAEDQWLVEAWEEALADPQRSPESLLARAGELREQGEPLDRFSGREALLLLAEKHEEAAAVRLQAR